jgi:DNA-binding NarL/FixJ family response regulator
MTPTRLILAYGDGLCRAGLRSLLERIPGVDVVGEASEGRQAVGLVKRRRPDLVILEDTLPGLHGVEATARIVSSAPNVRVAVLSDLADAQSVANALRAGAKGYLLKSITPQSLARAIRDIMDGRVHLCHGVSKRLFTGASVNGRRERGGLTPRQREILQMIAEGWSTKQIARILRISVKTVETHRAQLMERLGIFDVPGLVRYALKTKLSRL